MSKEQKYVVPKRELHEILCHSHSAIAHRGRDKLENYIKNNYAEIPQIVVKLFVSLCSIHEQQKSVADHLKKPVVHSGFTRGNRLDRYEKVIMFMQRGT